MAVCYTKRSLVALQLVIGPSLMHHRIALLPKQFYRGNTAVKMFRSMEMSTKFRVHQIKHMVLHLNRRSAGR